MGHFRGKGIFLLQLGALPKELKGGGRLVQCLHRLASAKQSVMEIGALGWVILKMHTQQNKTEKRSPGVQGDGRGICSTFKQIPSLCQPGMEGSCQFWSFQFLIFPIFNQVLHIYEAVCKLLKPLTKILQHCGVNFLY